MSRRQLSARAAEAVLMWGSLLAFCVILGAALYFGSGGR